MSRFQVLVSADRVDENLNTPGIVLIAMDEDTCAYDGGHLTAPSGSTGSSTCRTR